MQCDLTAISRTVTGNSRPSWRERIEGQDHGLVVLVEGHLLRQAAESGPSGLGFSFVLLLPTSDLKGS